MKTNTQEGSIVPAIIAVVVVLIIAGGVYYFSHNKGSTCWPYCPGMTDQDRELIKEQIRNATTTIVGNDRDAHGCIGSAGYSWNGQKQKCVRLWEEATSTTQNQNEFTPIITSITPLSGPIGTTIELKGKNLAGSEGDYIVQLERSDGRKTNIYTFSSYLSDHKEDTTLRRAELVSPCEKTKSEYYHGQASCEDYFEFTPGIYKVSIFPGVKGNEFQFTITN